MDNVILEMKLSPLDANVYLIEILEQVTYGTIISWNHRSLNDLSSKPLHT